MTNTALLTKVRDHIAADPTRLDMTMWVEFPGDVDTGDPMPDYLGLTEIPCGTTACIAGWTVLLDGGQVQSHGNAIYARIAPDRVRPVSIRDLAEEKLGLSFEMANWLFNLPDADALWALDKLIQGNTDLDVLMDAQEDRVHAREDIEAREESAHA